MRRLEELESLALGFPGVEQAYAIQAGREIRVLVDSQQLSDAESAKLCRDIAKSGQSICRTKPASTTASCRC